MSTRDGGRLTLRAIEVFVAVVEEGSLASAAQRLGASPSSVFQQLTNLETALGARLIDRAARPFALTPAGAVFLKRALTILDEATGAMSELAEMALASLP
ncbi:MAG: LysR family transcriptional regulator, partial [Pseudomonadota bacterium]